MFNNFAAGTEYFVVINGSDPLSFTIAGDTAKDVARIAITKTSIVKDVETDPDVRLYNKDEVDITESIKAKGLYTIDLKSSDDVKLYPSGGMVNMYNVGDTADLTATFTFYDDKDNYTPHPYSDTKKSVCIAAATAVKTGLIYTVGGSKDSPKHYFALGDKLKFQAWLQETLNGTTNSRQVGKDDFGSVGATYARVADTSIAMITGTTTGAGVYDIVGNQKGSTYVFICYTDGNGNEVIFDTCAIEVRDARYPNTVTATVSRSNLNKDAGDLTVTAIVKDQYGDPITTIAPTWTQLKQSEDKGILKTDGTVKFTLNNASEGKYVMNLIYARDFAADTKEGAVVLTIQAGDKSNKPNVQFSVASKSSDTPTAYDFATDKTSIDTALKLKTAMTKATVALTGTKDGYYVKDQTITGVTKLDSNGAVDGAFAAILTGDQAIPTNSTVSGSGFVLDIKKDGKRLNLGADINPSANDGAGLGIYYSDFIKSTVGENGKVVVASHYVDLGTTTIYKVPNGNYSFELYVVNAGKIGAIRRINISVTDTQVMPTFTKTSQSIDKSTGKVEESCFEFKFDGQTQSVISVAEKETTKKQDGSIDKVFVKKINVTISVAADDGSLTGKYTIPVTVNTLLDK